MDVSMQQCCLCTPIATEPAAAWSGRLAASPAVWVAEQRPGTSPAADCRPHLELSLILPARDESAGIRQVLEQADRVLAKLGISFELIVVDDGSRDGTSDQVRRAAVRAGRLKLVRHQRPIGYGAALRSGLLVACGRFVAFTDADGQFDLRDLARLRAAAERADVACGRRIDRQDAAHRLLFSWCYNTLIRFLLGIGVRDCDCALKLFRRELLDLLLPRTDGYLANAEMLYRAKRAGLSVVEVGVRHLARRYGDSKVTLLDVPRTLLRLLPFLWQLRRSPLRVELAAYERPSCLLIADGPAATAGPPAAAREAA